MKPKPVLFATALVAIVATTWLSSEKNSSKTDTINLRSRAPREKNPASSNRSTREFSQDKLLIILKLEGAAAALAAAKSQSWPNRDAAVYFILTHLATDHPEFVAAELKSSGLTSFLKSGVLKAILNNWQDGNKALAWAESQLTGELRSQGVAGALGVLAKTEPDAAFRHFLTIPTGKSRTEAITKLFAAWGSIDPSAALMKARTLSSAETQSAIEQIVRGWTKTDPDAAAAWVLETAPNDGRWIAGVYQSWIEVSPEHAKRWFDSLPEGEAKKTTFLLTHTASGGFTVDFNFARFVETDHSWATKPPSERNHNDLMHWAIQDTEDALAFVEKNGSHPLAVQLRHEIAEALAGKLGPSEAMDWALRQTKENGNRERFLANIFSDWDDRDPAAAARKLEILPPEQLGTMPGHLVNTWVNQDPAAAAAWVAEWQGANQTTMIESVIDQWPEHDPAAAYHWLGNLPEGAGRDAGIRTMMRREKDSEPETLQPWINMISNPQLREKTRQELERLTKQ